MNPIVERLSWFVPLLLSLSVHEWAHAWAANRLGDDTARLMGRMTFDPLVHIDPVGTVLLPLLGVPIGWAKPVPVNPLRFKGVGQDAGLLLCAAAGPASNLVLALILALLYRLLGPLASQTWAEGLRTLLAHAVPLNIALAAFNLLPLPPLDGGRIADAWVPYQHRMLWMQLQRVGPVLLVVLLFGAMWVGGGPLVWLSRAGEALLGH